MQRFQTPLWHPFADMAMVQAGELVLAAGNGFYVYDEQGRRATVSHSVTIDACPPW
jgi:adenosylmethionine-8-amino-7-oxononanoate aminotransferase